VLSPFRVLPKTLQLRHQPAYVTVTVDEGETYNLGKVAIDGPTPINPDELLKAGDFKTGDLVNFDHVNEGLERMKKALRHDGYMKAQLTTRRSIDDDKRSVALTLRVDAGPLFTMRKLTIVGLDPDGEAEINRIWVMQPGKPFNPDYPDPFLKRIQEEGVFDNLGKTKAEYKINEQDHTADVTLTFNGGTPPPGGRGGRRGGRGEQWNRIGLAPADRQRTPPIPGGPRRAACRGFVARPAPKRPKVYTVHTKDGWGFRNGIAGLSKSLG